MKPSIIRRSSGIRDEEAVSSMVEYLFISGILMILLVITALSLNTSIIERPVDQFTEYAFIDIGNGVSTRIVDIYIIAPPDGDISTRFDIPDDVAGRGYSVEITAGAGGDQIRVARDSIQRSVSLAGIGETLGVAGNTTGQGLNVISYNSGGYEI